MLEKLGNQYRWVILGVCCFSMGTYGMVLNVLPPILPLIITEFGFGYYELGILQGIYNIPGILIGVVIGGLAARYGNKQIGVIASGVMLLGNGIFYLGGSYQVFLLGRLLAGVGASTLTVVTFSAVYRWFKGNDSGLAFGIFIVAFQGSVILSSILYSTAAIVGGWQLPTLISLLITGGQLVIFSLLFQSKPPSSQESVSTPIMRSQQNHLSGFKATLQITGVYLISLVLFQVTESMFVAFGPNYFAVLGFSLTEASRLTSSWLLGSLILSIPIGKLIDYYDISNQLIFLCEGIVTIGLILLIQLPVAFYPLFIPLLGFLFGPCRTLVVRQNGKHTPTSLTEYGSSLFSVAADLGIFLGPVLIGYLSELFGTPGILFPSMIVALLLTNLFHLLSLKQFQRKPPEVE